MVSIPLANSDLILCRNVHSGEEEDPPGEDHAFSTGTSSHAASPQDDAQRTQSPCQKQWAHLSLSLKNMSKTPDLCFYNPCLCFSSSLCISVSLRKAMSLQNLSQIETPWEGVTLNRCMIIAITILLLSSGFQKLHGKYTSVDHGPLHILYTIMLSC